MEAPFDVDNLLNDESWLLQGLNPEAPPASHSAPEPGVSGLSDPSQTQGNQGSYHDLISPTSSASFSSSLMPGYHPYAIQNHHAPPGPAQQPWISHHVSLPVSSVVTEPIHDNFSFPAHGAMTANQPRSRSTSFANSSQSAPAREFYGQGIQPHALVQTTQYNYPAAPATGRTFAASPSSNISGCFDTTPHHAPQGWTQQPRALSQVTQDAAYSVASPPEGLQHIGNNLDQDLNPTPRFSPNRPQPLGFNANNEYLGTASPTEDPRNCVRHLHHSQYCTGQLRQRTINRVSTMRRSHHSDPSTTQLGALQPSHSVSRSRGAEPRYKQISAETTRVGAAASSEHNLIERKSRNETSNGGRTTLTEDTSGRPSEGQAGRRKGTASQPGSSTLSPSRKLRIQFREYDPFKEGNKTSKAGGKRKAKEVVPEDDTASSSSSSAQPAQKRQRIDNEPPVYTPSPPPPPPPPPSPASSAASASSASSSSGVDSRPAPSRKPRKKGAMQERYSDNMIMVNDVRAKEEKNRQYTFIPQ
ncbi:hypothetical protein CVT26_006970 [Gymnopilus dilepis]|uniref:Uncharacterized protein n=1 Tax=Gymnopilus dilepis TaxID=231916 RepID=A0A409W140_9AGAR|nr:hypothetical protein CVT26_006970 [Gymnopilus dilepis]